MKRLIVPLMLVSTLLAAQSVRADPPKVASTPYVIIPAPTAAQAQPDPGQILPAPTPLAPMPVQVSGTPVTIIPDQAPFVPSVGSKNCPAPERTRFLLPNRPLEPCNCFGCSTWRCTLRFQWGSCRSFFGEGTFDGNKLAPVQR